MECNMDDSRIELLNIKSKANRPSLNFEVIKLVFIVFIIVSLVLQYLFL